MVKSIERLWISCTTTEILQVNVYRVCSEILSLTTSDPQRFEDLKKFRTGPLEIHAMMTN